MSIAPRTLEDMKEMAAQFRAAIDENTRRLEAANIMIAAAQENVARNAVSHQNGSFTSLVIEAIHEVLWVKGPTHRKDILARLQDQGLHFSGKREPMKALASFLHKAPNARSIGGGVWDLANRHEEVPIDQDET